MGGLSIKGLDIFERPAELGKFSLILFMSEILFLVKIDPELIVAFSGTSIVSVGCEDQGCEEKRDQIKLHK